MDEVLGPVPSHIQKIQKKPVTKRTLAEVQLLAGWKTSRTKGKGADQDKLLGAPPPRIQKIVETPVRKRTPAQAQQLAAWNERQEARLLALAEANKHDQEVKAGFH
jgi:hypothetical protein